MKLYAKATSDRATKGQGGNEYINIHLYSGSEKDSRLNYTIEYKMKGIIVRDDSYKILLDTTKGEKQKIEKCYMHAVKDCYHCTDL